MLWQPFLYGWGWLGVACGAWGRHVRQGVNASDNAKLTSSRLVQLLVS